MKEKRYVTISGGGTAITYLGGAVQKIQDKYEVVGYGGTSAGFLLAVAGAFDIPSQRVFEMMKRLFRSNLVKPSLNSIARGGILDWEFIANEIDNLIGKDAKMGDAKHALVGAVTNLDTRSPMYLTKIQHPDVLVKEVAQAASSFMCGATPAHKIESLGTKMSPDRRLFVDGGFTDNTVDAVFDSKHAPSICLRLRPDQTVDRVQEWDLPSIHKAVFLSSLYASSQWKSERSDHKRMDVYGVNDWNFTKDAKRVEQEWNMGYSIEAR
jgi:predicted acylesterase/phospholipase RssA